MTPSTGNPADPAPARPGASTSPSVLAWQSAQLTPSRSPAARLRPPPVKPSLLPRGLRSPSARNGTSPITAPWLSQALRRVGSASTVSAGSAPASMRAAALRNASACCGSSAAVLMFSPISRACSGVMPLSSMPWGRRMALVQKPWLPNVSKRNISRPRSTAVGAASRCCGAAAVLSPPPPPSPPQAVNASKVHSAIAAPRPVCMEIADIVVLPIPAFKHSKNPPGRINNHKVWESNQKGGRAATAPAPGLQ